MQNICKKVFSLLLAFVLVLGMVPASVFAAEAEAAQWVGTSLNLSEELTLRFYVDIPSAYVSDGVMTITVDGVEFASYQVREMTSGENGYAFPVALGSGQMTSPVVLTLTSGGETVDIKTSKGENVEAIEYSIREYALDALNGEYSAEMKTLVRWMLNYGAAAQEYFGVNTDKLANDGYMQASTGNLPEEAPAVDITGKVAGIEYYGASMVFRNKVALRFYFKVTGDINDYTIEVNGQLRTAEKKGEYYYVEMPDLNPQSMDEDLVTTVSKGTETITLTYSPMDYITRMYRKSSSSSELKTMLAYASDYFNSAEEYVVAANRSLDITETYEAGVYGADATFSIDLSDYSEDLNDYRATAAKVNGTAFTTVNYDSSNCVVSLDRATVQALEGEQTIELTFMSYEKVLTTSVKVNLYTMLIASAADMAVFPTAMAAKPAGNYALASDIDMAGVAYENTNTAAFTGIFDGRGYVIYNMATKTAANDWDGGFFGKMFKGTLKNVAFANAVVKGEGAFLAFRNNAGTMENVYILASFDGMVSGKGWINDTSVLFNDGEGNYLYANNVIVEYAEPLTASSAGYAFYQNLSVSKFNGLYVVGADKISVSTLSGSSTAYGCYEKRSAFDVDVSSWEGDFWTVLPSGFPIPKRLKDTSYENGPIYPDELTITDTFYAGAQNTGDIKLDLSGYGLVGALQSALVDGAAVTASLTDGVLTLSRDELGALIDGETKVINLSLAGQNSKMSVDLTLTVCTYTMGTSAELAAFPSIMKNNLAGTYVLTDDIDMAGVSYSNTCGDGYEFAGTFDGQGYVIYNMATKTTTTDWAGGLFGKHFNGILKNVAFVNATVKGQGAFLACKGNGGTLENIYFLAKVEDLVSSYTTNGWINNTSVFFNTTPASAISVNNVVLEYTQTLTDNNGWGYAFGLAQTGTIKADGFYIIGADKTANSELVHATALYGYRAAFDANVSAWDDTDFWAVVDEFPVPERLVGVKIPFAINSDAVGYVGAQNSGNTFTLDLSDVKSHLAGTSLVNVTLDGTSFATKTYKDNVVTLDKATVGALSGEKEIVLTFESATMSITVTAKIASATYVISTPAEMAAFPTVMASYPAGTYVLANDIDMAGVSYSNGYTAGNFTGTFDGQGYVIYNMTTKTTNDDWDGGFFGKLFAGTIKNVAFANATVKGQAAFLAFRSIGGKLENVYISFDFDSMVSGTGNFTQDTSVLFNDGNGNYLDATNVVIEYAELLTGASAGYAVYQSFSQSKINGLYVIGADKVITNSFTGSNGIFGCYNDRASFTADVSAWDALDFWTVLDSGFPVPTRLVGTIYENGYVVENELDMTASAYMDGTETSVTAIFANASALADKTFHSATLNGEALEASYNGYTGGVTLNVSAIGALTESQQVKVAFIGDDGIYVAYVTLIPADKVFYTAADLATFPTLMAANPAGTYALGNDIDMADVAYENTNDANFTGVFDGNGYVIYNMATKTSTTDWDGGFFGKHFAGTLKNISFKNAIVRGQGAFLAFRTIAGTMENVYIQPTFDGLVSGTNNFTQDTCVLFNDGNGNYLYATNVIIEYAETPAAGGYAFYQNLSVSKFNGLYVIGADKISVSTLSGSSTAYGCYGDRAALATAVADFSSWYATGFWVNNGDNTPIPAALYEAPTTGPIHQISVVTNTTRKLIQGGSSDYKIIVDETNTADKAAADIMIKYLARSGVTLPIVTADQYTAGGKFIVINNDNLFASAGLVMDERLDVAGYMIQTVGDNVFLQSAGVEGIQYAAASFLKHVLKLEVYGTPDSISVPAGSWAWMPDINIIEQPDIATHIMGNWRDYANADVQYLMGYTDYADYFLMSLDNNSNGTYDIGTDNHTSMNYLPRETYYDSHWKWYSGTSQFSQWFNAPDQLCYTAHGSSSELAAMVQAAADEMMVRINAQPKAIAGQFSVSDTETACQCSYCKDYANAHGGTPAAAVIRFVNLLSEEIQSRLQAQADAAGTEKREFTLYLMAYHEYATAPVTKNADGTYSPVDETVVCGENVGVLYAPIEAMYTTDLYDDVNAAIAENMEKWASLSDHMYYWLYDTSFKNYFVPYGSWNASVKNMGHSYNNNASIVFIQGQFNTQASSGFTTLKVYLNAAAAWNVNSDYDALVDTFFANYYGAAGEPMRTLFNELEAHLKQLEINYPSVFNGWHSNDGQAAATYWPETTLNEWMNLIEQAKTLAAGDTSALNHITDESMFIRYLLITAYGRSDLAADFNSDAAARGFTHLSEQETLGTLS